ncbi:MULTISPECIES: OmpA/MotB family protein [unclassified Nocardioides]|uniref:OmpA/MotB family protein n=1 Tax=unclassified Nocardioides TaxID=2615069 RepID=UPI0009F079CE|nr:MULTISPECIES: flagellar motor protein MotB [unclassified Nocardioides]GAW51223.1 OmpA/MotB domain-containing protein [Nocardioides sp. PD653-B2]GAW56951.1 OmpA/MotB domain-containing protein [Nocardioides sp. PD653]
MTARRRRHEEPEEPDNHERWLVTYADMLTLLMVLFIVMFAMSQVDDRKYAALRSGLAEGFGAESSTMSGTDSILEDRPPAAGPELISSQIFQALPDEQRQLVVDAVNAEETRRVQRTYAEAETEADKLEIVRKKLMAALVRAGLEHDVRTTIDERGLVVSLVSRHVVFQADIAELSERGRAVVDTLAPVLREVPNALRIDGHTNQEPVQPRLYATDWDLSAARAVTVLRRLNEQGRVPQERLSLSAFGHERPLVDPRLPDSQQVNKRVDIVVLPDTDVESSALIDDVMQARPTDRAGAEG